MSYPTSQVNLLKCDASDPRSPPPYEESFYTPQPPHNPDVYPQMPYPIPAAVAPPPPGLVPQLPTQVTRINVGTCGIQGPVPVGPHSMPMRCHHCGAFIKTSTSTSCKSSAHFACFLLMFFTCGICSCIPYCMNSCKKVHHKCPNCNGYLGSYEG